MRKWTVVLTILLSTATAASAAVDPELVEYARKFEQFPSTRGQGSESESERLRKLFDLTWDYVLHASPDGIGREPPPARTREAQRDVVAEEHSLRAVALATHVVAVADDGALHRLAVVVVALHSQVGADDLAGGARPRGAGARPAEVAPAAPEAHRAEGRQ